MGCGGGGDGSAAAGVKSTGAVDLAELVRNRDGRVAELTCEVRSSIIGVRRRRFHSSRKKARLDNLLRFCWFQLVIAVISPSGQVPKFPLFPKIIIIYNSGRYYTT